MKNKDFIEEYTALCKNMQNQKARAKSFRSISDKYMIHSLSLEDLEAIEETIFASHGINKPILALATSEIDYLTQSIASNAKERTRRQRAFGVVPLFDTAKLLVSDKGHIMTKTNESIEVYKNGITKTEFYHASYEKDSHFVTKTTDLKMAEVTGGLNPPPEIAFYVKTKVGEDILICRMDCSHPHVNKAFVGSSEKESMDIISAQAEGYHFHFAGVMNTMLASNALHPVNRSQTLPDDEFEAKSGTKTDAISAVQLSAYLKALDGVKVAGFNNNIDLTQPFGLPFTFMKEKGCFPECDLRAIYEKNSAAIEKDSRIKLEFDSYRESMKGDLKGFESFYLALDLFNGINNHCMVDKQAIEENRVLRDIRTQVAEGVFGALTHTLEKQYVLDKTLREENVLSNESSSKTEDKQVIEQPQLNAQVQIEQQGELKEKSEEQKINEEANALVKEVEKQIDKEREEREYATPSSSTVKEEEQEEGKQRYSQVE